MVEESGRQGAVRGRSGVAATADRPKGAENLLLVAVTEANSEDDMDRLVAGLEEALR